MQFREEDGDWGNNMFRMGREAVEMGKRARMGLETVEMEGKEHRWEWGTVEMKEKGHR